MRVGRRRLAALAATCAAAAATAGAGHASAPPVGPLPAGPLSTVVTQRGELVAVALPHRSGGRVWRLARAVNPAVLRQVSEADVGASVVLVFRANGRGTITLAFGLTVGEKPKASESRRFQVQVR